MQSRIMKHIHHISRCSTLYRDLQLKDSGLTGYQAPYLPIIYRNPGLTQDELAKKLHVNRSSVTRQLALLEEDGFVTRQRSHSDKRSIQVYPQEKLNAAMPELRKIFANFRAAITDQMTAQEVHTLTVLLEKLSQRAEELINECEDTVE
ncbi:MAG: MarR family transcriptional regulator [Clostridiales bacterium]|nr:MarR family transcriptional regulator [Clostridiales bacterium]